MSPLELLLAKLIDYWLQKPAYSCMRGQQTGLQANDDWSKMKKKKVDRFDTFMTRAQLRMQYFTRETTLVLLFT